MIGALNLAKIQIFAKIFAYYISLDYLNIFANFLRKTYTTRSSRTFRTIAQVLGSGPRNLINRSENMLIKAIAIADRKIVNRGENLNIDNDRPRKLCAFFSLLGYGKSSGQRNTEKTTQYICIEKKSCRMNTIEFQ